MQFRSPALLAATGIVLLALTACSGSGSSPAPTGDAEVETSTAADGIVVGDAWVKSAAEGMTAAFGEIRNSGPDAVTIVSAATASSPMIELHETVQDETGRMVMRERDGGFVVPAGGSLALAPGGDHLMLMGLTTPLAAGDETTFTLTLDDGSTVEFSAPVKDYSGANETYEGDMDMEGSH